MFNEYGVRDFRQIEIHTAEPLVPEPSGGEFEMAIERVTDTSHQLLMKY